ncbi:hypothetical protein PoB_000886300 [Plakobranchus ocellatus]|uniref:Uncharacterized protein n=1 Tax=Plakobranchus ocellatus TaxID=259542 RepID=A0AAV3YJF9_9GAST|nr:hypothetical protein PoB_000886300 [Plakobranchus ocellatus]
MRSGLAKLKCDIARKLVFVEEKEEEEEKEKEEKEEAEEEEEEKEEEEAEKEKEEKEEAEEEEEEKEEEEAEKGVVVFLSQIASKDRFSKNQVALIFYDGSYNQHH